MKNQFKELSKPEENSSLNEDLLSQFFEAQSKGLDDLYKRIKEESVLPKSIPITSEKSCVSKPHKFYK